MLGLALWLLTQRQGRAFLRTPWPYLALALAVLAVSNLLWFNLRTGGGSLENVEERRYAFTGGARPGRLFGQRRPLRRWAWP